MIRIGEPGEVWSAFHGTCHETIRLHPTVERPRGERRFVRRPTPLFARVRPASSAQGSALLGPDHPLVRVTDALQNVIKQWLVVAALLAGSIAALIEGTAWAKPVALGAAVVLAILAVVDAAFGQRKRDRSIDLILEGRETVPIAAVQHSANDSCPNGPDGSLPATSRRWSNRRHISARALSAAVAALTMREKPEAAGAAAGHGRVVGGGLSSSSLACR